MHEMSICISIVESLEQMIKTNNYKGIKKVWLEIGVFSGVEVEALKFSFEAAICNTIINHAQLEIIEKPAKAWCFICGENVIIKQRYDSCPKCDSNQLTVTNGEELKIKQVMIKE